ncbi:MAG TPA: pyridoxal-phosphate dependent enzyme, partial [bacterium]|nr:pyridoxal-phosphate dependent enzyme [bacterium]
MATFSSVRSLACLTCGRAYPLAPMLEGCPDCQAAGRLAILDPVYAYDDADRAAVLAAGAGRVWDYHRLLPIPSDSSVVTLGEGGTPLLPLPRARTETHAAEVWVKYEGVNPTHSFKDRANAVAVSAAVHFEFGKVMCSSTGNHGVALAAYAARAGVRGLVLLPPGAPAAAVQEIRFFGAEVVTVGGEIVPLMTELWRRHRWYISQRNAPGVGGRPFGNPFGMEGYKTIAYEIFHQLGGRAPDKVLLPVGGGDGAWGIYKGFDELRRLGLSTGIPQLIVCQSTAGAPLVEAWRRGLTRVEPVETHPTIAFSIVDRQSGDHALEAIRRSGGRAVAVDDAALRGAEELLGRSGICVEPSSAASLAGLRA